MFEIASQMTMCLLIAGLFGFIIGYLSSNKECVEHHHNSDDNHKEVEKEAETEIESKDDLTKIKGLGPKIETTLNTLGITTFKQIASWTKDDVDMVNKKISIHGKSNRASWIKQAKSFIEES